MAFKERASTSSGGFIPFIIHTVLRVLQFIFAVTVLGLYGVDISDARKGGRNSDSRWVYAEVVAAFAAITSLVYMVPFIKSYLVFAWDAVLFILWVAVFGVFGKMFIPKGNLGSQRMKNAVWIDLINMLLWLISAVYGAVLFFKFRGSRSLHTGRATV
ncbi:hypothetical protein MMC24_001645 [Lignoscripta atroalba]|nr:hypothetical protein [Lignoscripta atroalba]